MYRGVIQYVNARKMGYTDVTLQYECSCNTVFHLADIHMRMGGEKMLIYSLDRTQTFGHLSRHSGIRQLELFQERWKRGNLKYRYTYIFHREENFAKYERNTG